MPSEITMPQLSDTMTEGTLVKWHKAEGQSVRSGEELADVETDKATMPMEAFDSGTLAFQAVPEGTKVAVGGLLGVLALAGEDVAQIKQQYAAHAAESPSSATQPAQAQQAPAAPAPAASPAAVSSASPAVNEGPVRASPLARKIAKDLGLDLRTIRGSGPNGRIVQQDVLAHAAAPKAAAPVPVTAKPTPQRAPEARLAPGQTQKVPLTKMRSAIAAAMARSKQTIPHFYITVDVDMQAVSQLRAWMNKALEPQGQRLSLGDFVTRATALALVAHPDFNGTFDGQQLTRYGDVHLGLAVALPEGLIVPVLRDAQSLDLRQTRQRSSELVESARQGRLKPHEMSGATFTITNLGQYEVREFGAIVNPPQVAILAVGTAQQRAVVREGAVVPRWMMSLTLSCDHRAVDGAGAAEFLRTLRGLLEEPGQLIVG
jgi:pyruvate dehydrogenase E2 component (dihydrolipoamide acetyltransferase)